jgi:hypothetical protein
LQDLLIPETGKGLVYARVLGYFPGVYKPKYDKNKN